MAFIGPFVKGPRLNMRCRTSIYYPVVPTNRIQIINGQIVFELSAKKTVCSGGVTMLILTLNSLIMISKYFYNSKKKYQNHEKVQICLLSLFKRKSVHFRISACGLNPTSVEFVEIDHARATGISHSDIEALFDQFKQDL